MIVLQHPTERFRSIGTSRMASLCLRGSELRVGVDFSRSALLDDALSRPAALLFPGPGAIDVEEAPPIETLVVVDGTWHHAKSLVRRNPRIATLPRIAFTPRRPSEYRIRKEPRADYVSTIEALAHVLGVLEGDAARFEAMLVPFRKMIDAQIAYERAVRSQSTRRSSVRKKTIGPRDLIRTRDVVCAATEASAWPDRGTPELVHLAAHRLSDGASFEALIAPAELAPSAPIQIRVPASELTEPRDRALARWRAFLRETDVLCVWGAHAASLVEHPAIDVRALVRDELRGSAGAPLEYLAKMGAAIDPPPPLARGRAGERLAQLVAVAQYLSR